VEQPVRHEPDERLEAVGASFGLDVEPAVAAMAATPYPGPAITTAGEA